MTAPGSITELAEERRERLVRGILERAAPVLSAHAATRGPVATIARWLRPAVAAAVAVGVLAAAFLAGGRSPARAQPAVSEALGYPLPVVGWVEAGRRPSVEELVVTLEEMKR